MQAETLLTVRQVAAQLQVSRNKVYAAIRRGELRAVSLSARSMRVRPVDLQAYLQRREAERVRKLRAV